MRARIARSAPFPLTTQFFLSASFAPGYSFRACVSSGASTDRRASPFPPSRSRKLEEDPEYAKMMWARNQKEMMQTDEVSMRLYSELDLIDAPAGASAIRISV